MIETLASLPDSYACTASTALPAPPGPVAPAAPVAPCGPYAPEGPELPQGLMGRHSLEHRSIQSGQMARKAGWSSGTGRSRHAGPGAAIGCPGECRCLRHAGSFRTSP